MTTLPLRITGGVDTHLDVHVAAALDHHGALLGVESFDTTPSGYRAIFDWLCSFGEVEQDGNVEGPSPRRPRPALRSRGRRRVPVRLAGPPDVTGLAINLVAVAIAARLAHLTHAPPGAMSCAA